MPVKNDTGHQTFEVRTSPKVRLGGVLTEGDPASIPQNRFRMLVNTRFDGPNIIERPGLEKFTSSALHHALAQVRHLATYEISTPSKIYMVTDGCPGISSTIGAAIATLDQEQDPENQQVAYYNSATNPPVVAKFGSELYIGVDSTLKKLNMIITPWGKTWLSVSGSRMDEDIYTFSAGTITCMQQFDGKLFIGVDNGAGSSKIYTWDGVSIEEDDNSLNAPTCFGLYHVPNGGDALVVGFGSATNKISYRSTGDPPGTWTDVAPGAGTLGSRRMATYKDVLYIANDNTAAVWSYDGTTLGSAHAPASATNVRSVHVFNGYLYFCYTTATAAILGKFDGSTWTDVEKNFTTQVATITDAREMVAYRQYLYVAALDGANMYLYHSGGTTTTGTWTAVAMAASLLPADIDQMVVV